MIKSYLTIFTFLILLINLTTSFVPCDPSTDDYFCIRGEAGNYLRPHRIGHSETWTWGLDLEYADHIICGASDVFQYRFDRRTTPGGQMQYSIRNKLRDSKVLNFIRLEGATRGNFFHLGDGSPDYNTSVSFVQLGDSDQYRIEGYYGDMLVNTTMSLRDKFYMRSTKGESSATPWSLICAEDTSSPNPCNLETQEYFCLKDEATGRYLRYTGQDFGGYGILDTFPSTDTDCKQQSLFLFYFAEINGQLRIFNKVAKYRLGYAGRTSEFSHFILGTELGSFRSEDARFVRAAGDSELYYLYSEGAQLMGNNAVERGMAATLGNYANAGRWSLICSGTSPDPPDCDWNSRSYFCIRENSAPEANRFLVHDGRTSGSYGGLTYKVLAGGLQECEQNEAYQFWLEGTGNTSVIVSRATGLKVSRLRYIVGGNYVYYYGLHRNPVSSDTLAELNQSEYDQAIYSISWMGTEVVDTFPPSEYSVIKDGSALFKFVCTGSSVPTTITAATSTTTTTTTTKPPVTTTTTKSPISTSEVPEPTTETLSESSTQYNSALSFIPSLSFLPSLLIFWLAKTCLVSYIR